MKDLSLFSQFGEAMLKSLEESNYSVDKEKLCIKNKSISSPLSRPVHWFECTKTVLNRANRQHLTKGD